jgi:hypothetical protein
LVQKVVPEAAMRGALEGCNAAGQFLADRGEIIRAAKVESVSDLNSKSLELSDALANGCHNWAVLYATGEGALTGWWGIFGAPIDIPVLITLAFRTIHKIGLCYGFESTTEADKQFVLGILAATGANSLEEKAAALATLTALQRMLATQTWKTIEKTGETMLGKEAAIIAIRNLAKQLGVNLTKRKAAAAIPVVGMATGAGVNGWYVNEVSWAARRSFQERWLLQSKKAGESDFEGGEMGGAACPAY